MSDVAAPVAIGFRAQRGGSVAVAVRIEGRTPRVLLSTFLATAAAGDRLAYEPYHVAAEMLRGAAGGATPAIEAAVAEGRARQAALASAGLADIVAAVRPAGGAPLTAALLVNRAGWVTDLLAYSLAYADHPPVAEGLAVRDALRAAFVQAALPVRELDEKSLTELASHALGFGLGEVETRMKDAGVAVDKPWRKEQKSACLAAWLALAEAPVTGGARTP